jgi:biopolymer transport protein ExbB
LRSIRGLAFAIVLLASALAHHPVLAQGNGASPPAPSSSVGVASASAATIAPGSNVAVVENPYGLEAIWKGGDLVSKITLGILVLMSFGSWYVIVVKVYEQAKLRRDARRANAAFWTAATPQEGAATLPGGSAFRFIVESALAASNRPAGMLGRVDADEWTAMSIQRAIDNVQSRLQDGLGLLATVGSTAPFVGLFGTVWGIYHALTAIGIAGQASIDKVAGPVGEALIMTALGLAVAVPAVLGYNWLVRRNKAAMDAVRRFGADLNAVMLSTPLPATAAGRAAVNAGA